MRIGLLGGTFDPPHKGHIDLAHAAQKSLSLDEVLLVPVQRNPEKSSRRQTPAKQRMEMLELALKDEPALSYSDIEIVRGGVSYSLDTVTEMTFARPAEYWFIVGADALRTIESWKQPERLLKLCRLGVALRKGQSKEELLARIPSYVPEHVDWVEMDPVDISATEIRQRILEHKAVGAWLKPDVQKYIEDHHLYRS